MFAADAVPVLAHLAPVRGTAGAGLAGRGAVVVVARAPGQQQHLFVGHARPVARALGHRVSGPRAEARALGPDDPRAHPPAVGLECERRARGNHDQVLGLEARCIGSGRPAVPAAVPLVGPPGKAFGGARSLPAFPRAVVAPRSRVTIAEVEPHRAVVPENPAYLPEHLDQVGDVKIGIGLEPEAAEPGAALAAPGAGRVLLMVAVEAARWRPVTAVGGPALGRHRRLALVMRLRPCTPLVIAGRIAVPGRGRDAVIAERVVGRARDHAVDRALGQLAKALAALADEDADAHGPAPSEITCMIGGCWVMGLPSRKGRPRPGGRGGQCRCLVGGRRTAPAGADRAGPASSMVVTGGGNQGW